MKYFSPSYWFKLWVLSAPLFNDKTQGINAKSIDNKKIKDWVSKNTSDISLIENQELNLLNNQTNLIIQQQIDNVDHFYENFLKTQGWSKDPQIAGQQLQEIQEEHHKFLKKQHEESKRHKRQAIFKKSYIDSKINLENTDFEILFTPEFFEEINSLSKNYFIDKCISELEIKGHLVEHQEETKILELIYSNLSTIRTNYINSSKLDAIKIKILKKENTIYIGARGMPTYLFKDSFIANNKWYSNKYLDNLKRDFPDWDSNTTINLGLIYEDNYENFYLKYAFSKKYPNFNNNYIAFSKKEYSNFCNCFLRKMVVRHDALPNKYSIGLLNNIQISYITETKLNEISNYIANDWKTKQWLEHINDYNKNLPTKIEHLKSYTDSQKWSAKNTEKEIIKGYIRDWTYVSTLIEHEWKLDELNKNIQGLKTNFDSIKNQINELDNRVQNLENVSNWNCANIGSITGGVISAIPIIGTIGGAVATITSGACAIAGV